MKKVYLCALALSIGTLSFGQYAKQNLNPLRTNAVQGTKSLKKAPQDKGAVVWSDDFSRIAGWNLTNTSSPTQDWIYETDPTAIPVIAPSPVGFTTASNGYLYIDSDNLGGTASQNITAINDTAIDLTLYAQVSLVWEQDFISFQETFTVSVSGDNGSTWTDYVIDGLGGQSEIYETRSINISAVAGSQSQVFVKFNYQGQWDWMWAIDDVEIQVTDPNDMVASAPYYGFGPNFIEYTRIPVAQISASEFGCKTTNVGSLDQVQTILTADVNGGLYTGTSTPITNSVGATDSLFVTSGLFTPGVTVGVPLNITLTVSATAADATPADNISTFSPVEVSQYIYAHDDYTATGNGGGYYNTPIPPTEDFEAGNYFDIIANQTVYAIDVVIGTNAVVGSIIDVVLYDGSVDPFVQIDRSTTHVVAAGDIGNVVSLALPTTPALLAGDLVFAAVHGWGGVGAEFFYGTSGTAPDGSTPSGQTSLVFYPSMSAPNAGENFYTTRSPMVRMNFDPGVGINEVSKNVDFNVYPNPSPGIFNINLNADISDNVNLTVKNIVGQTIINKTVSVAGKTMETISLADYSKGVYFLTIDNNTVKLIVE